MLTLFWKQNTSENDAMHTDLGYGLVVPSAARSGSADAAEVSGSAAGVDGNGCDGFVGATIAS